MALTVAPAPPGTFSWYSYGPDVATSTTPLPIIEEVYVVPQASYLQTSIPEVYTVPQPISIPEVYVVPQPTYQLEPIQEVYVSPTVFEPRIVSQGPTVPVAPYVPDYVAPSQITSTPVPAPAPPVVTSAPAPTPPPSTPMPPELRLSTISSPVFAPAPTPSNPTPVPIPVPGVAPSASEIYISQTPVITAGGIGMIAPIAAGATRLPMIFSGLGRLMSQGGRMGVLSGRGRGAASAIVTALGIDSVFNFLGLPNIGDLFGPNTADEISDIIEEAFDNGYIKWDPNNFKDRFGGLQEPQYAIIPLGDKAHTETAYALPYRPFSRGAVKNMQKDKNVIRRRRTPRRRQS